MGTEYIAVAFTILFTIATSALLGGYMYRVFSGQRTWLDPVFVPIEKLVLRLIGADPNDQQDWKRYSFSLLVSNVFMWLATWTIVTLQQYLPLNPDGIGNQEPTLAFNTISSFVTNTNLQHYSGETGLSYLSQMFVITFLQFVTAATGVAAAVAIIRGLAGNRLQQLGNFYVDLTRATVRLFLPLALLVSVLHDLAGDAADVRARRDGHDGRRRRADDCPRRHRGGGVDQAARHQRRRLLRPELDASVREPDAAVELHRDLVDHRSFRCRWSSCSATSRRRKKLAVVIFATMLAIYLPMVVFGVAKEAGGNPAIARMGVDQSTGSMEGKEVRFGAGLSALWAVTTTVTSNGSVNAMHDSLTPLGGLMPLVGMWLNNIFGGVGVGFINMLIFVIVAVFVAGMMIGRTPEFLGKKVEAKEVKLASLALLWHPLAILLPTAIACYLWATTPDPGTALAWLKNPGPHGFSEMLYEFTSSAANNGSGFEGLGDNTPFWNIACGLVMLLSRYIPIIAPLALAGSLAAKPAAPETAGSLRADSATFGITLWAVIVILGLLMFMPVAVLGPIAEHLALSG